jgi:peroxiredoxin
VTPIPPVVGQPAPDFTLRDQHGSTVRLSDFRGRKNVVIVFYPGAFSAICTDELGRIRDNPGSLADEGVEVLAISCDPLACLRAFSDQEAIGRPLLSDFWPHGEVAKAYGVFFEPRGFANRGTFLVDREGILRWSLVTSPGEPRDPREYDKALAAL